MEPTCECALFVLGSELQLCLTLWGLSLCSTFFFFFVQIHAGTSQGQNHSYIQAPRMKRVPQRNRPQLNGRIAFSCALESEPMASSSGNYSVLTKPLAQEPSSTAAPSTCVLYSSATVLYTVLYYSAALYSSAA